MRPQQSVSPELIFETFTAFHRSAAVKAAVDLDLFTRISDGSRTAAEIGDECSSSERGIRILCDAMTVLGFLDKTAGRYSLTEISAAFLDKNSPAYMGGAAHFLMSDTQKHGFDNLTEAVIKGGSVVENEGSLEPDSPMWVKFARGMMPMMMPSAQAIAENLGFESETPLKVLDIAAGHGIFGITVAQKYSKAEIYAVDWENVLSVASENAEKFGVADRYNKIIGSAFDVEFGDGYDLVLLTNFLHHFDAATNEALLGKINASLKENGKVVTLEFIPDEDRISPPTEAMFSLVMLAATPAGDAYTFRELRQMFENTGFTDNFHIPLEGMPQHIMISTR